VDRVAAGGDSGAFAFPRAMAEKGYDFSFSGLKTAVVRAVEREPSASTPDVAASFQEAVVDVLVTKARRAVAATGSKGLCLAGGVAANSLLRARVEAACVEDEVAALVPSQAMCTDNAAMIAAAGQWRLAHGGPSSLDLGADPNLALALGAGTPGQ
jgi:N6-L-threonylcarbamoyladenine synthase